MNSPSRLRLALTASVLLLSFSCGEQSDSSGGAHAPDPASTLTPRFSLDGDDFYRMPWPSDARLDEDGTLRLDDVPGQNSQLITRYVETIGQLRGYSTTPVAYFPFDSTLVPSAASFPDPATTATAASTVQLLDLSDAGCGARVPVTMDYKATGDTYTADHTLQVGAYPGFTLHPERTYAFVVTRDFGSPDGLTVSRPDALDDALQGRGPLADVYSPLRDCAPQADLVLDDVAIATVFTTQDPVSDTRAMRDVVMASDTPSPTITDWQPWPLATGPDTLSFRGYVDMPIFQAGDSPYQNRGGELVFDDQGTPQIQTWESAPFAITLPRDAPPRGLPVIIWEDGTGADLTSHVDDAHIRRALLTGFAILTFEPQFHGERATTGSDPVLSTFNYLNPASGRTTFRQQAVETSYMIRLIRERLARRTDLPDLDTERILFGGHSQGALVGAIAAGVEPDIDAFFLNGVGGYLSETIVWRKDIVDIQALVKRFINLDASQQLDRFHLVVQLAQTGADAVDPLNYARYWKGWDANPSGTHLFMSNGKSDQTTSTISMTALMTAGDVPTTGIAGWEVDPTGLRGDRALTDAFVSGNRESTGGSALTFVSYANKNTGHFTLYRDSRCRNMALEFWDTALSGVPEVSY